MIRLVMVLVLMTAHVLAVSRTTYRTEEGATVGGDIVTNGSFDDGSTGWIPSASVTISGGNATWTANGTLRQNVTLAAGYYEFIYTVSSYTSGAWRVKTFSYASAYRYGPGTFREILNVAAGDTAIFISAEDTGVGVVSSITVKPITAATVVYNPLRVAITGDSIAQHHAVEYPDIYPGDTAYGHSLASVGVTSEDYALGNRQFDWVVSTGLPNAIASGATTICIHCGHNDLKYGRTWEAVLADLNSIRSMVITQALFLDDILPWTGASDAQALQIRQWNTNISNWCSANNATMIPVHDALGQIRPSTGELDDLAEIYDIDGIHPTPGGHYTMWTIWGTYLQAAYGTPVRGGVHYFLSSSGSDSNNGMTQSAPWATLTNFYQNGASLGSGDSVWIKAGDSFDGPLVVRASGESGHPITIGRYSTGNDPIIYGDHSQHSTWSAVGGYSGVYSNIIGVAGQTSVSSIYDTSGNAFTNVPAGSAFATWLSSFTASTWGVTNLAGVDTVYIRTADDGAPPAMRVFELNAVGGTSRNYVTVQNFEVCNSNIAIEPALASNWVIQSNYVHDTLGSAIYLATVPRSTVARNTILRAGNDGIFLSFGGSNWVHHNVLMDVGPSSVLNIPRTSGDRAGIGLQQGTNNLVEWNTFSNIYSACLDYYYEVGGEARFNYGYHFGVAGVKTGTGIATDGTGLLVHHNLLDCDNVGVGIIGAQAYDVALSAYDDGNQSTHIYNNVVVNPYSAGLRTASGNLAAGTSTNVVLKNNIVLASSTSVPLADLYPGVEADYNLYYCSDGTAYGWKWNTARQTTLANWRSTSAQDTHGIYANPLFVSSSNFALQTGSPAIGAGVGVGLTTDYAGNAMKSPPSIGAYEYYGANLSRVTNLRVSTIRGK